MFDNIAYQSFCWVLGTTSFRTAQLNVKIEQQLIMLYELHQTKGDWQWNSQLQTEYYDFMQLNKFVKGDASRKDKDAREKTSGLVDIGLLTANRELTEVGKKLKNMAEQHEFEVNNFFELEADSDLYFKQLLKTHLTVGNQTVRPYIILAKLLKECGYLSYTEFTYLLPLCTSDETTQQIIENIPLLRQNKIDIHHIIDKHLMSFDNYQMALNLLKNHEVSEDLICVIGMNRKSRNYDKPYYDVFLNLIDVFIDKNRQKIYELFQSIKKTKQAKKWLPYIFASNKESVIRKQNFDVLCKKSAFFHCKNIDELKIVFFKYLHIFKAMATLEDYFDLNQRYFNLTNTIIFDEQTVKFDILPNYYFKNNIDELYKSAYQTCKNLTQDVELNQIHSALAIDEKLIFKQINQDYRLEVNSLEQVKTLLQNERYERFEHLLNTRFTSVNLIELLDCFETRSNDNRIRELVTDDAEIYTSFEYVIGLIWYRISEQQGDILKFLQLSLQANLLPKSHAQGGYADIIYKYSENKFYPKHDVLIEATLATGNNQRRMELEPVSRHLGDYLLDYDNACDYSIFVSTFLHLNVISDFRHRKTYWYYPKDFPSDNRIIKGMKIIPIDTAWLKNALIQNKKYADLYTFFDDLHNQEIKPHEWQSHIELN